MKLTFEEMLKKAQNPRFKVTEFIKEQNGFLLDGITPSFEIVFTNSPKNYMLISDPIEPENVALLEDLDHVTV